MPSRTLQRQGFEVCGLGAGALGCEQILLDAGDELVGAFADLVLLAGGRESQGNLMTLPVQFERREARQHAIELLGGAFGEHHHEFISVETNGEVGAANDRAHSRGEFTQSLIAGIAAKPVIDSAELPEIEHDEGEWMAHALGACDFGGEALLGEAAIVETGERVNHREITQTVGLCMLVGKLSAQLLDDKFLAKRVKVEENDGRDEAEDGFGEANFEKGAGALLNSHHGEGDDCADKQEADGDGISAHPRIALLNQRQFLLEFAFAGLERRRYRVIRRSAHV